MPNRCVFRCFLKVTAEVAERRERGSLFHELNARFPHIGPNSRDKQFEPLVRPQATTLRCFVQNTIQVGRLSCGEGLTREDIDFKFDSKADG